MSELSGEHTAPVTRADDLETDARTTDDANSSLPRGQAEIHGEDEPAQPAGREAGSTDQPLQDSDAGESGSPLVKEASAFRSRWESVQVSFVDDPRQSLSDAESLVVDVLNDMTAGFRHQRQQLESMRNQGQESSTEDLRQTFQRYRDFFDRLLRV